MIREFWNILMKCLRKLICVLLKPFHQNLTEKQWNWIEQFIKFALVGCSNALILLAVYYIIIYMLGDQYYLLGQTLGYIAGIFNSFFWNSRCVFRDKSNRGWNAFVKMCICYGSTYLIQIGLLYALVELLALSNLLAPIIAITVTTPINFIVNKTFAFHEICK